MNSNGLHLYVETLCRCRWNGPSRVDNGFALGYFHDSNLEPNFGLIPDIETEFGSHRERVPCARPPLF